LTGVDEDEIHAMVVCQLASEICIHIQENGFNYRVEETLQIASKATMSLAIEYRGVLGNGLFKFRRPGSSRRMVKM
jgi:hypothetical protein